MPYMPLIIISLMIAAIYGPIIALIIFIICKIYHKVTGKKLEIF